MKGASILKQPLPGFVDEAANALRATRTLVDLQTVWFMDCDNSTGEVRERLQDVYAEQVRKLGALHG